MEKIKGAKYRAFALNKDGSIRAVFAVWNGRFYAKEPTGEMISRVVKAENIEL